MSILTRVLKKRSTSTSTQNPKRVLRYFHPPIYIHKRKIKTVVFHFFSNINKKKTMSTLSPHLILLLLLFHLAVTVNSIGVNYGTLGDNLPPPTTVANFLKTNTIIDRVKIYDVSPQILQAFANTGIAVTVTAPNGDIATLTNIDSARQWVVRNIKPFHPMTKINYILVGSEVLHWGDNNMIHSLVPAMRTLHSALLAEGITDIKVN